MAQQVDNSIQVIGNYLKILRLGKDPVWYVKKNTTMNVNGDTLTIAESGEGSIQIKKSDVDAFEWSASTVGILDWNTIQEFFAENTGNFNSAAGGSAAPLVWFGKFQASETPTTRTNYSGIGEPTILRIAGGLYRFTFPTNVFADITKIYVTTSDEALSRAVISSQGVNYVEISVYNQSEVQTDTNASFQVKIEYFG